MKFLNSLFITSILAASTLLAESKPVLPNILNPEIQKEPALVPSVFKRVGPTVQIGILLDTSNSMDGLITQAKDQLWKIVNEVAKANKNNKDVNIQVGLFEYGKSSLPQYEGYLQMLLPLSDDLDKVSQELYNLRTKGGDEFAGKVILESVNRFVWSKHKDDLKLLIIAGNENFNQGNVPYTKAIEKAKSNGIIVNTIFCGPQDKGRQLNWADAAKRGDGKYFNINQDEKRVYMPTPYDDEIILLGKELNKTYLSYGSKSFRQNKMANVIKQDANSMAQSKSSYIERNLVKSKKQYASASSDIVSAYEKDASVIEKVNKNTLPDELQNKSKDEIKKILEEKKAQRTKLQKEISTLEKKRTKHLASNTKSDKKDLGSAIINSIKEQASSNGYIFKK